NSITFGIETFSQKMLDVYNKQNTVQNNIDALNMCKELDIPVRCSLIYGGPFETRKTLSETIKAVKQTQPDEWNVATFVPIPGSDIGDNPSKYKTTCYKDLDYLKYHRVGESGFGEILIDISTMSPDQYKKNRKWFVGELEKVCPRKNIQDSIQTLRI
ncbi:MAG: radical SAM protein, partial [Nitrosopumilus sp.]